MKNDKKQNLRRLRYGTASTVLTVVVIVAILLLNILVTNLANRYPLTWDLTDDKAFSLSEESLEIAKHIENKVEIVVFNDEKTFSDSNTGVKEVDTTLREFYNALQQYRSKSGNKVTFRFINPNQDPAKFAKYKDYDVATGDILFISGKRYKTSSIQELYEIEYLDYYGETYNFSSKVEKVLGSKIYSLQSENDRIVQVLVGHEEDADTIAGLQSLYELNGYSFEQLAITGSVDFNKDAEILLIPAPAKDYSDKEIKRVRDWFNNNQKYGRHLVVFVNATADCPNLYGMLESEHQIKVMDEMIYETDYNRISDYSPFLPFTDVPQNTLIPNFTGTGNVFTPMARRLTTTLATEAQTNQQNENVDRGTLLTNYPESAMIMDLQDFDEQNSEGAHKAKDEEYPLTSMIAKTLYIRDIDSKAVNGGSVLVSGCPMMAYSDYIQNGNLQNEELLLGALNAVTGNESAVTISDKVIATDTVEFSNAVQMWVGLGVFTLGIPVLVLIICLVVFLRRKNL